MWLLCITFKMNRSDFLLFEPVSNSSALPASVTGDTRCSACGKPAPPQFPSFLSPCSIPSSSSVFFKLPAFVTTRIVLIGHLMLRPTENDFDWWSSDSAVLKGY